DRDEDHENPLHHPRRAGLQARQRQDQSQHDETDGADGIHRHRMGHEAFQRLMGKFPSDKRRQAEAADKPARELRQAVGRFPQRQRFLLHFGDLLHAETFLRFSQDTKAVMLSLAFHLSHSWRTSLASLMGSKGLGMTPMAPKAR